MATIRKEIEINAPGPEVWDALRDFGALTERLVPGFVTECQLDGDSRLITFDDGVVVRERLVAIDDKSRRLVYTTVEAPIGLEHHSASCQVLDDGDARCRFVWIVDLLPDNIAPLLSQRMDRGIEVIKTAAESATPRLR